MPDTDPQRRRPAVPLEVVPTAARLAASAWWRVTERSLGASLRLASRIARAATGDAAGPPSRPTGEPPPSDVADSTRSALRDRGSELLRRSADVRDTEDIHPAYARILDNLSPDEARILRLFAGHGPQPAIDVRRGLPLMSELVAPGLTTIGAEAGCRHPDRMAAYLDNLNRLGLIWFSRETLRQTNRYQLLEAQPEATAALRQAGRTARTVRRSIQLTPFGTSFCEVCLPAERGA